MVKTRPLPSNPVKRPSDTQPVLLKGWKQVSDFLGQSVSVAQRWSGSGMPVRKEGRYIRASPDELSRWLGKESGTREPVHIVTDDADLLADLKRGLAELRRRGH